MAMGTIWPRPACFHVTATSDNLVGLAGLAERHADPELADHVHVHKDGRVLIEWHDAFFWGLPIFMSKEIPEENVRRFCEALSVGYETVAEGG